MKIQQILNAAALAVACGLIAGCVSPSQSLDHSSMSPLEIRAMQTRSYENRNAKTTLKAVLDVLQDDDFLVDYGDIELGLLHATKIATQPAVRIFPNGPARGPIGPGGFVQPVQQPPSPLWIGSRTVTVEATVNVSEYGKQVKVRINFQQKVSDLSGWLVSAIPISDAKSYQEFFAKLDRGLFIQKQGL